MIPTTSSAVRRERLPTLLLWSVLGLVLIGVVSIGVWSLLWEEPGKLLVSGASPSRLPVYGSVSDFALIDQHGRPVRRADFEGKVWIVSFIFTNCPDECPLMAAEMAQLQSDLAHLEDLRLVSISVDPEYDTPTVLLQYAARFNADSRRWLLLTGDKRAIYRLAREGFRLGIVDPNETSHSSPVRVTPLSRPSSPVGQPPSRAAELSLGWSLSLSSWWRALEPTTAFADHGRSKDPLHSSRFVLIDRQAQIRGYYESRESVALQQLRQHLQMLFQGG